MHAKTFVLKHLFFFYLVANNDTIQETVTIALFAPEYSMELSVIGSHVSERQGIWIHLR